jgi:MerR family transcriptional regulator, aldehyde-responsive regulator
MTISEVSEKYAMTQDTLRYYERVGLIPPVPRKPSGIRDYDAHSCGWIEFIRCMRRAGLPVEALSEYVRMYQEGDTTKEARRALLVEERRRLDERIRTMLATRERLDYKIANYDKIDKVAGNLEKADRADINESA